MPQIRWNKNINFLSCINERLWADIGQHWSQEMKESHQSSVSLYFFITFSSVLALFSQGSHCKLVKLVLPSPDSRNRNVASQSPRIYHEVFSLWCTCFSQVSWTCVRYFQAVTTRWPLTVQSYILTFSKTGRSERDSFHHFNKIPWMHSLLNSFSFGYLAVSEQITFCGWRWAEGEGCIAINGWSLSHTITPKARCEFNTTRTKLNGF